MIEALKNITYDNNPCIGCTSTACRTCAYTEERDTSDLAALKVQRQRKKAPPKKKLEPPSKKDPLLAAFETPKETLPLPSEVFGELDRAFVLLADGDGMRNAGILSGDQIIFEQNINPSDGDIIVGRINGDLMCRRVFFENDGVRVRREDGETPDIFTTDYVIFGTMVGLARNCRKAG